MLKHIKIEKESECCGCGACVSICPKTCITMKEDTEGFLYPDVDESKCVGCSLCTKVCPVAPGNSTHGIKPVDKSFAVANIDESVRADSTSGGAFNAFVQKVLSEHGVIFGARFDDNWNVVHAAAKTKEDAALFYGSKYVQSNLLAQDVFRDVLKELAAGKEVLFSGTPCQVHAINLFLEQMRIDRSRFYTCDFVCRAVPSPGVWRVYLQEIEKKYQSKPKAIAFRNKTYGYHSGSMKVQFENGKCYFGSGRVDNYHKAFFADLISRPSCYSCPFRTTERVADFTLFDCWHYERHTGKSDDDLGYTHLWVRGDRADKFLKQCSFSLRMDGVDLNKVLFDDGIMATKDISPNNKREGFLRMVRNKGLDCAVKTYIPVTMLDRMVERVKRPLYRVGLIRILKRTAGR